MPSDLVLISNDFLANKAVFSLHQEKLQEILKDFVVSIEHVGSTSIPNTIGKGMIDIIIACETETHQYQIKDLIIANGYRQGELNKERDGRLFFCSAEGRTQAGDIHLHLVIANSYNHLEVIEFRDYLLGNPDAVEQYNNEKLRLAQATNNDRSQYVKLKEPFIKEILNKL
jgi:GrpB-like predicted nucleotidyltransferase (UPF0157 family)